MRIVPASLDDLASIESLRLALWPDSSIDELTILAPDMIGAEPSYLVLIACADGDEPIGFAEVTLRRDYVNGCDGSPVAFLEGIYVAPGHRRQGVARALVEEAKRWGGARGAAELASDALLDNLSSHAFHSAIGFEETERVVYFRRMIDGAAA
ncbi:aminoglycoside 6'-N-acetyltransferase [Sphingobium nicotianae]|uniref:Aminoglycoside N(6')-acetyltransferase type 1 n=1 Tax=Sphingobium nicotianae TaxID=2782607 RepID=A0A9X1DCR2_9SPHN|nr:aminoglycoside 6'-N-acetyltransferase [Sphingobium nicotianae]MBT2187616.1 GNAT family N-acetyltransferase [Sphingobium nicotianae]